MPDGAAFIATQPTRPVPRKGKRKLYAADLFCGAGGFSQGALDAASDLNVQLDLVAINHWLTAIETQRRNHPNIRAHCMTLEAARPEDLVPGGMLDILVASPECTHFSSARGGKPTSDQNRVSAWHIVRWATSLRIRVIVVENVPDFITWGPVGKDGKPIKSRKGEYFNAWVAALRAIGYVVEWRIINTADHGDATTRRRFFLQARSDGLPIEWEEPSHAPADVAHLLGLQPWRTARQCINWNNPGRSIFRRKRLLAANSINRIRSGIRRFSWPAPFDALIGHFYGPAGTPKARRGTKTTAIEPFILSQASGGVARRISDPVPAIPCGGAHQLVVPFMMPITHAGDPNRVQSTDTPFPTITCANRGELALIHPFITPYYCSGSGLTGKSVDAPLDAVTTKGRFGLVTPVIAAAQPTRKKGQGRPASPNSPFIVEVDGQLYYIDILYRMLEPEELAAAMSFHDEKRRYDFAGNKTEITKQIGNAVPCRTARSLLRAAMRPIVEGRRPRTTVTRVVNPITDQPSTAHRRRRTDPNAGAVAARARRIEPSQRRLAA